MYVDVSSGVYHSYQPRGACGAFSCLFVSIRPSTLVYLFWACARRRPCTYTQYFVYRFSLFSVPPLEFWGVKYGMQYWYILREVSAEQAGPEGQRGFM